jgi:hypothetical protein
MVETICFVHAVGGKLHELSGQPDMKSHILKIPISFQFINVER